MVNEKLTVRLFADEIKCVIDVDVDTALRDARDATRRYPR